MINKTYKNPAQEGLERKIRAWDKKDLGMQIGACINKAVDIAIAKDSLTKKFIAEWVDILFEIGNEKRDYETTPRPIDIKKAVALGNKWKEKMAQSDTEFSQVKGDLQTEEDTEKANRDLADIPVLEEEYHPEETAERQFEEKQINNESKDKIIWGD